MTKTEPIYVVREALHSHVMAMVRELRDRCDEHLQLGYEMTRQDLLRAMDRLADAIAVEIAGVESFERRNDGQAT